jgi:hypothetical protein
MESAGRGWKTLSLSRQCDVVVNRSVERSQIAYLSDSFDSYVAASTARAGSADAGRRKAIWVSRRSKTAVVLRLRSA